MFRTNELKIALKNGATAFGCWVSGGSVSGAEILGHAGFDFLLLDHEHGAGEIAEVANEIRAVAATPTPAVVRVPWNDHVFIKRILDAGVQSVMIPSVDTAEQARAAVAACLYPPQGRRGYAVPVVRASTFGLEPDYLAKANENILTICQIESATAVENIEEICAVEGLDCVFIGVNDLSGSIGKLEQSDCPEVRALIERAEKAILRSGKIMGTIPSAGASLQQLVDAGYRFIIGPHEVALLRDAARDAVSEFRKISGGAAEMGQLRKY